MGLNGEKLAQCLGQKTAQQRMSALPPGEQKCVRVVVGLWVWAVMPHTKLLKNKMKRAY